MTAEPPNLQSQTIPHGPRPLQRALQQTIGALNDVLESRAVGLTPVEVGRVISISHGTTRIEGLVGVQSQEVVRFPGDLLGIAFNLDPDEVGVVMLDSTETLNAGAVVQRTHRQLDIPVGEALLGRVVDGVGRPLDNGGPIHAARRLPIERPSPEIMDRSAVSVPLQTGIKVIDALIPVGRGQRELILGDRQTGKTALAIDTIINQRGKDVLCVYCAIGQRSSAVARVISDLDEHGARDYTTVVVTTEDDPPGMQFAAPYGAMSIAEHFMQHGRDVLVVLDDLTRHARAYRELSSLLRRPPGREAFPGDIFYIHSRLLERSTHLREEFGGGSVTALPIVETEAQNLSGFIPTNLISITDGQIYLSPELFDKGIIPAVDVGRSVSRVGGKTQLKAFRAVAGDLRIAYAQFEELETFARFGTRLDDETRKRLERGRRVREILKQPQYSPLSVTEQVATLAAVNAGLFDDVGLEDVGKLEGAIRHRLAHHLSEVATRIEGGTQLTPEDLDALENLARDAQRDADLGG